jgi:hypothetical protein
MVILPWVALQKAQAQLGWPQPARKRKGESPFHLPDAKSLACYGADRRRNNPTSQSTIKMAITSQMMFASPTVA